MDSNFKTVCNGCHNLTMLSADISYIGIITVIKCWLLMYYNIRKSQAINVLENPVLKDRG